MRYPDSPSVWSECHPDVLACLRRFLEQDLTNGKKTVKNCRLVNRHWYRELTRSIVDLTPKLTIFTFWDLDSLRRFSNLKKLTLRDHSIVSDSWLHELPKVTPQIEALAIRFVSHASRRGPFSKSGIQALLRLKQLTHLEIAGSEFTLIEGIRTLASMIHLTYLDLSENGLSHRFIQPLTTLSNLQSLILGGNDKLGDKTVRLMRHFGRLKHLSVRSCRCVSDIGIWNLSEVPALTSLDVRMCNGIGGVGFSYCKNIPLSRLDLMGCSALTNSSISHLSEFRFLKCLDVRMCPKITDTGLEFLKNLASLVDLRIGAGTRDITNAGLAVLVHLPCLEFLTLFFLSAITHQGLDNLNTIETLRKLTIVQCQQIAHISLRKPSRLAVDLYPCTIAPQIPHI